MKKSIKLRGSALIGLTAAALGLGVLNASFAAADSYMADTAAGYVEFNPDGDKFWVYDTTPDGYSAAVQYKIEGQRIVTLVNDRGADSSKSFVRNFPEDRSIDFRACAFKTSTHKVSGCGDWVSAYTFSYP